MSNSTLTRALYPIYLEARKYLVERREAYELECEEYAREGYRPHYCIHGVNMWVDYDCACWRCEEGVEDQPDAIRAHQMARDEAYRLGLELRPRTIQEAFMSRDWRWEDIPEL